MIKATYVPAETAILDANQYKENNKIESIIVTAQKREEDVQKVPISINLFSESQLEDTGTENVLGLTQFTPNIYMKSAVPENTIIIR